MGTAQEVLIDGTPTNGANPLIDSLVNGGAWADSPGLPTSGGPVTISVAAVWGVDPYGVILGGPTMPWSQPGLNALGGAMGAWEAVANIDFVSTSPINADVWLWQTTSAQIGPGVLGIRPGSHLDGRRPGLRRLRLHHAHP
jgi:hypothetical protein